MAVIVILMSDDTEITRLLRQTTGHMEHPRLQQQQRNPNRSQRTLTGSAFLSVTLTRVTVAWSRAEVNIYRIFEDTVLKSP